MIEVSNLTKQFGSKTAVDNLSFSVGKGEVLGFLGPNGAGKSTTMRMVTGYLPPTRGSVMVGGADMVANPVEAKKKIGYLPENAPLYPDMTVQGFLSFIAELRGLRGAQKKAAVEKSLELCFLEPVRNQLIDTLSKGYRHRTCLAQSVLDDPDILILDEPTDGLDPNQKHEVRSLIKRMGENKVIIFSTHILEEVDAVCSRALIIDRGKVIADGPPAELRARSRKAGSVLVDIEGLSGSGLKAELERISKVASIEVTRSDDSGFAGRVFPTKSTSGHDLSAEISKLAAEKKWVLRDLHVDEGRLDEMFREITDTTRS
ncbi:MAG: ATP-binding cassette domain-containing protein [Verrucomicrobiae bacterium]|nr:ATP-binding cassette domain-containing protein [Verrucomicrobiae bacterium]